MKINTALEMIYLFNLGIVSLLNTVSNHNKFIYYIDIISVSLSLLIFVGILLGHIYMYIKQKYGKKMYIVSIKGIRLKLMKKSCYKRDHLIHLKMRQNNILQVM